MLKRTVTSLAVGTLLLTGATSAFGAEFLFGQSMSTQELTAQQKFDELKAKGIFNGINSNGDAALDQNMNRAQFARVAALILNLDGIGTPDTRVVTEKPFDDVNLDAWYVEEVAAAKEAGIMVGNGNGTFKPTSDLTVQELAVSVGRLLDVEPVKDSTVDGASDWAAGYIKALQNNGIFLPGDYTSSATRQDLVEIIYVAEEKIAEGVVDPSPTPSPTPTVTPSPTPTTTPPPVYVPPVVQQVSTPTANVPAGAVLAGTNVELSTTTSGATIYYTIDGSTPTTASTVYVDAIEITEDTTIRAIAVRSGYTNSAALSVAYTVADQVVAPTASVPGGVVDSGTQLELFAPADAIIYYTLDGSDPTEDSTEYVAPIIITTGVTVKAIAVAEGYINSEIITEVYTITPPDTTAPNFTSFVPMTPDFWTPGSKSAGVSVEVDEDSTIYYVIQYAADPTPTAEQVIAGEDYAGTPVYPGYSGSVPLAANTPYNVTHMALGYDSSSYTFYIVACDANENCSEVLDGDVVTPDPAPPAPTFTINSDLEYLNPTTVRVLFSDEMNFDSAENVDNYVIEVNGSPIGGPTSATLSVTASGYTILLSADFSGLIDGDVVSVTVSNVLSAVGGISPTNSVATFTYMTP